MVVKTTHFLCGSATVLPGLGAQGVNKACAASIRVQTGEWAPISSELPQPEGGSLKTPARNAYQALGGNSSLSPAEFAVGERRPVGMPQ